MFDVLEWLKIEIAGAKVALKKAEDDEKEFGNYEETCHTHQVDVAEKESRLNTLEEVLAKIEQ